jgi:ATP-dependent DNA helicase RecG
MSFEPADHEKLGRLKAPTLLHLALILPRSYRDTRLHERPAIGADQAVRVEVQSVHQSPKRFSAKLHAIDWGAPIEAVYFHAKQWQKQPFVRGAELLLFGRVQTGFGPLQLIQPIVLKEAGGITPIYKTPLQNRTVCDLMRRYVNRESLMAEGLPEWVSERIVKLHHPIENAPAIEGETLRALKFAEIFRFLKGLSTRRRDLPAIAAIAANPKPFIESLPFELTGDQLQAIEAARHDLARDIQARRLIIGDVGCGKTLVMLAIAYMVGSQKTVLMAPTTLLANQLYEEARKFLGRFLPLALVTQKSKTDAGDLDSAALIIGTHALLYRELPQAACVMVDEQHRFGTAQRKRLADMTAGDGEKKPHFFQFSATPIPRTLAMIQSTLLDISAIREMPFKKQIQTRVIDRAHFKELIAHIHAQIEAGNQILIVYPHIEESEHTDYQSLEQAQGFWLKHFDGVFITHGRDKDKEEVLIRFRDEGHILLATTVVEVGISLPRLTTIVIAGAERLGLATLHQLRGRVGRMGQKSWCFYYTNRPDNDRLNELASTLDGFAVAELDLKTRSSGDLLEGILQSGQSFEWFDMATDGEVLEEAKRLIRGSTHPCPA